MHATLSDLTHFELPPIVSKLTFECHPNILLHAPKADEWFIDSMNIVGTEEQGRVVDGKLPWFASMTLPRGNDDDKMILAGISMNLFFLFDDVLKPSKVQDLDACIAKATLLLEDDASVKFAEPLAKGDFLGLFHEVVFVRACLLLSTPATSGSLMRSEMVEQIIFLARKNIMIACTAKVLSVKLSWGVCHQSDPMRR